MTATANVDKLIIDKEIALAEQLLKTNPDEAESHAKKVLCANKKDERGYIYAAKAALMLDCEDRAKKYLQLGMTRCPHSTELPNMIENIEQLKKQFQRTVHQVPHSKNGSGGGGNIQEEHTVKPVKELMFACLKEGSEALLIGHFKSSIESYKKATELSKKCIVEEKPEKARKYAISLAYIGLGNYESLVTAAELLGQLKGRTFPAAYYGMALVLEKFNRYTLLLQEAVTGENLLSRLDLDPDRFCWPGKNTIIEETQRNKLLEKLTELRKKYKTIPKPDAVCRLSECLEISSHIYPSEAIYKTDPDFIGYFVMVCEENCRMAYHVNCWKHMKEKLTDSVKIPDKDMLGTKCPTDGCITGKYNPRQSIIIQVIVYDVNNEIKTEMERERTVDPAPPPPPQPAVIPKKPRKRPEKPPPAKSIAPKTAHHPIKKAKTNLRSQRRETEEDMDAHETEPDLQTTLEFFENCRTNNFGRDSARVFDPSIAYYGHNRDEIMDCFLNLHHGTEDHRDSQRKQLFLMYYQCLENMGPSAKPHLIKFMRDKGYCRSPDYVISEEGAVTHELLKSPMFACIDDQLCLAQSVNVMYNQVKDDLVSNMQKIFKISGSNPAQQSSNLGFGDTVYKLNTNVAASRDTSSPASSISGSIHSNGDQDNFGITNLDLLGNSYKERKTSYSDLNYIPASNTLEKSSPISPGTVIDETSLFLKYGSNSSAGENMNIDGNISSENLNQNNVNSSENQEDNLEFKDPFLEEPDNNIRERSGSLFGDNSDSDADQIIVPHKEIDTSLFAGLNFSNVGKISSLTSDIGLETSSSPETENKTKFTLRLDTTRKAPETGSDTQTSCLVNETDEVSSDSDSTNHIDIDLSKSSEEKMQEDTNIEKVTSVELDKNATDSDQPEKSAQMNSNTWKLWTSGDAETPVPSVPQTSDIANMLEKYKNSAEEAEQELEASRQRESSLKQELEEMENQLKEMREKNSKLERRQEEQALRLQKVKSAAAQEAASREKDHTVQLERLNRTLETTRDQLAQTQKENASLKSSKSNLEKSVTQMESLLVASQRRLIETLNNHWNYIMQHYNDLALHNVGEMYSAVQHLSKDSTPSIRQMHNGIKEWDDLIGTVTELNTKFKEKLGPYRGQLKIGKPADKKLLAVEVPKPPPMPAYPVGDILTADLNTNGNIFGVKVKPSSSVGTQTTLKPDQFMQQQMREQQPESIQLPRSSSTSNVGTSGSVFYNRNSPITIQQQMFQQQRNNEHFGMSTLPERSVSSSNLSAGVLPMRNSNLRPVRNNEMGYVITNPNNNERPATPANSRPYVPSPIARPSTVSSPLLLTPTTSSVPLQRPVPVNSAAKPSTMAAAVRGPNMSAAVHSKLRPGVSGGAKRTSYDILVEELREANQHCTEASIREALSTVRQRNNNKLTGLTKDDIARRVSEILIEFLMKRPLPDFLNATSTPTTKDEREDCCICYEPKQRGNIFSLSCKHSFHPMCIRKWLKQTLCCPVCRCHVGPLTHVTDEEFPPLSH